jgi:hypothetical protein
MHCHVVLNANPPDARYVYAWFDGNHVPLSQNVPLSTGHPWIFVHLKTKSVSGAMHKIRVKPVTRQNPSGGGIDIPTAGSRPRRGYRSRLRFLDRAIPSPYARRGTSDENSARDIAAIVGEYSTQVQYHQFIFPQSLFRRPRMGMR